MGDKIADKSLLVTRFAPSPSGYLHLGHAYSALFADRVARRAGGKLLIRIEDIDRERCQPKFEKAIVSDLAWLGLSWEEPIRRQSEHIEEYKDQLEKLTNMGLIYPCFCTRKDIKNELKKINGAPHDEYLNKIGFVYPGTCKALNPVSVRQQISSGFPYALRLDMKKAIRLVLGEHRNLCWLDQEEGLQRAIPDKFGDVVLARKNVPTSYHLSVVIDDAVQGVNYISRGEDLRDVTHIHCLLQALLGLNQPKYRFHRLLVDENGKKFSKRDKSLTLKSLRETGRTLDEIKVMIGLG